MYKVITCKYLHRVDLECKIQKDHKFEKSQKKNQGLGILVLRMKMRATMTR